MEIHLLIVIILDYGGLSMYMEVSYMYNNDTIVYKFIIMTFISFFLLYTPLV